MREQRAIIAVVTCLVIAFIGCGDEEGNPNKPIDIVDPGVDTIPPAVVSDLRVEAPSIQSLAIVWHSPGDDGNDGTAAAYDIRRSLETITEDNWEQATPIDPRVITPPKPHGQIETIVVLGLDSGTEYFFALKTVDEADNWSGLSNSASGTTDGELTPPGEVYDLTARAVDDYSFELTWTAPGDDGYVGRASKYEVRYAAETVTTDDWDSMTSVAVTPEPVPAGEAQSFVVHGLAYQTPHVFALRTADELDNWSGVSNVAFAMANGQTYWVFPRVVNRGELLHMVFETASADTLKLTTNGMYFPRVCGVGVIEVFESAIFPDGVHVRTFDFKYNNSEDYYRADFYWMAMCENGQVVWSESVEFSD